VGVSLAADLELDGHRPERDAVHLTVVLTDESSSCLGIPVGADAANMEARTPQRGLELVVQALGS
jgi:hypothetical protein